MALSRFNQRLDDRQNLADALVQYDKPISDYHIKQQLCRQLMKTFRSVTLTDSPVYIDDVPQYRGIVFDSYSEFIRKLAEYVTRLADESRDSEYGDDSKTLDECYGYTLKSSSKNQRAMLESFEDIAHVLHLRHLSNFSCLDEREDDEENDDYDDYDGYGHGYGYGYVYGCGHRKKRSNRHRKIKQRQFDMTSIETQLVMLQNEISPIDARRKRYIKMAFYCSLIRGTGGDGGVFSIIMSFLSPSDKLGVGTKFGGIV